MRARSQLCWLAWALAGSAAADVRVDYAVRGDCPLELSGLRLSGSQMRVEHEFGGQTGSSIFDGTEDVVIYLDHARRTWMEIEVDADAAEYMGDVASSSMKFADRKLAAAQQQMDDACKQMRGQGIACAGDGAMDMQALMKMAQEMGATAQAGGGDGAAAMDPGALQQLMAQAGAAAGDGDDGAALGGRPNAARAPSATASPRFSDSGRDARIAGATCRWHAEHAGDVLRREQCVATIESLPLADRDRAGLLRAMKTLTRYGKSFQPWIDGLGAQAEAPPTSQGLLLAQRCYDARGDASGSAEATLTQASIDEAQFEVPSGYARQAME